jgi:hypothetical protein
MMEVVGQTLGQYHMEAPLVTSFYTISTSIS